MDGRRGAASDQSEQPLSDCGRLDSRFGTLIVVPLIMSD